MTFSPALALFALGVIRFLKSNHEALKRAEDKAQQDVNPAPPSQNRHAQAQAQRRAERQGSALSHSGAVDRNANVVASAEGDHRSRGGTIEIDDQDDDFVVATDVSFPVEVQSADTLADPLRKLIQLLEQGVLTEEEYAVAKAKLLG